MNNELRIKDKTVLLFIDTSSNQEISVGLEIDGEKDVQREKIGREKAQVVLPLVQKLLEKYTLKLVDISSIEVNVGPGSFTGLRVGVSIANALGYALKIPVNGKTSGFIEPVYE